MKNVTISILAALAFLSPPSASAQTEMGVEHDFSVYGAGGTAPDPNVEIKGFTVFGSTQSAYTGAVIGPGNVVVNGVLAVSSGAYFVGNSTFTGAGKIFINDGSAGQLLRRNTAGYLEWSDASALGDNLGNHVATTTLSMGAYGVNTSSAVSAAFYQISGSTILARAGTWGLRLGVGAGLVNTGASNNFFGYDAGENNTSGQYNNFFGYRAGRSNTTGGSNVFNGHQSGALNTTGSSNVYMGYSAGQGTVTGSDNTAIGANAGRFSQTGAGNTLIGYRSGYGVTGNSFSSCTLVGADTGWALTTGSNNTFLGWWAGDAVTTGANNILIGYDIDASLDTIDYELNIGNVLYGNLAPASKTIGIGRVTQNAALDVVSTGTASNIYAQIWRNSSDVVVGSMSATGVMMANSINASEINISATAKISRYPVQAADTGITLAISDFGKTITVNSASAQTVYLPSVTSVDVGATIRVVKLGAGRVTVDAADSDTIADSGAGDTVYNSAVTPPYASIDLLLVTDTKWAIVGGQGAWITTD